MRRLSIAFILAIFLPLICACGDEPRDYGDFLTDIVTYEGSSDDGTAMFSFQSRDDLPLQRLAASIKLPSDIVAGQRCLLRYTVVGNLADGTRQVRADVVRPPCVCLFRRFCPVEPRHMPTPVDRHRRPHIRL